MRRTWAVLTLLVLLAACTATVGDESAVTTTTAPTSPTTGGETTSTSPPSTVEPGTSTTSTEPSTTTSTTIAREGNAEFAITQVVFGDLGYVIVANIGLGAGEIGGYWLSQRSANFEIPPTEVGPGEKIAVAVGSRLPSPIGVLATIDGARALGIVTAEAGEMALFSSGAFSDPAAIVDYVRWGGPVDGRADVAVAAGIWPEGGFVETQLEALAISVVNIPADDPTDWFGDIGG